MEKLSGWQLGRVARVTPRQIILVNGGRYWRESGEMVVTSHWVSRETISPATAEDIEEDRKNKIAEQLARFDLSILPLWQKIVREP